MTTTKNKITEYFNEFLQFMSAERNASISTLKSYKTDFKVFVSFLNSKEKNINLSKLSEIETKNCRNYIFYLKIEKQYSTATIRRKIHSLSSFFKFCLEMNYINKNPMTSIHAPKQEERMPIYLNQSDLQKLLTAPLMCTQFEETKFRDLTLIALLIYTGSRKSEIINLNWSNIDMESNVIYIKQGKGKKDREIPLLKPLKKALKKYYNERKPMQNEPVLLSTKGNRMSTTNFQIIFQKYIQFCGLKGKSYSPHKCRHSFATLLYQSGVDIITIQKLLGHSDLNSTKIYTHVTTSYIRKELDKFPVIINQLI